MPNLKNINLKDLKPSSIVWVLVRKELRLYFASPLAFIILSLFIIAIGIIFLGVFQFLRFGTADLTQLFTAISFAFIVIIPALVMGSISREKLTGTIEATLTEPITELEFILSKFLSYSMLVALMLLITLPLSIIIGIITPLDFGQVFMQYIGGFFLGVCFVSIGIAVSALFKNEIASLLTTLLIAVLFMIGGTSLLNVVPISLQGIVEKFSLLSHYQSVSRGVLDLRDFLYFFIFILAFLGIAYFLIVKDKFPSKDKYLKNLRIGVVAILVVTVLVGYIGQSIPGRIDFTSNQKYTLSEGTNRIASELKDVFNITLYASNNLPQDFQPVLRDVENILRDYNFASNGKIIITRKDPLNDSSALEEAQKIGVTENIFAVNTGDSSQQVVGYFGLGFSFLDNKDVLNLNTAVTKELEFQITKKIKKVANINRQKVAILKTNVKQTTDSTYTRFAADLNELFDVTPLDLTRENPAISNEYKVLIIPGPNAKYDDEVINSIKAYYDNGGSIFLMVDSMDVNPYSGEPEKNAASQADFFASIGITVNNDFVYDLDLNNQVQTGGGFVPVVVDYPFWVISQLSQEGSSIYKDIDFLSLIWASTINLDSSKFGNNKVTASYKTSQLSNTQGEGAIDIKIDQDLKPKEGDGPRNMVVNVENDKGGKAVIVSDSDYLSDDLLNALQGRDGSQDALAIAFATSSVEWLSGDQLISSIKVKDRISPRFSADSSQTAILVAFGLVLPVVLIIGIGGFKFYNRRKNSNKPY